MCRINVVTTAGPAWPPPWPTRPRAGPLDPPPHQDSHTTTLASACARSVAAASSSELLRRPRELLPRNKPNMLNLSRATCCQLWPAAGCPQLPAPGAAAVDAGPSSTLRDVCNGKCDHVMMRLQRMELAMAVRLCMRCLHAHRPPSHPEWPRNGRESSLRRWGRWRWRHADLDGLNQNTTFCCEQATL